MTSNPYTWPEPRMVQDLRAERDAAVAALSRVRSLADEWAGDPVGEDLWRSDAVDAIRAALDGDQ